jgi:hypothetical protein
MIKDFYVPEKPYSNTYGIELDLYDFEGHHTLSSMADKIAKAERFNKMCKQNCLNRQRIKNMNEVKND